MFYEKVNNIEDYIIKMRRHFHEYPELTGEEYETVKTIRRELDEMGVDYIEIEDGGILAFFKGKKPGNKKVLLRADIDALPIDEKPENLKGPRTCISKNPGVMHACGHDGHTAMLLGTAKVLKDELDKFGGEIILCFERGEEGGNNYRQILAYMERENIIPDAVWGLHLVSDIEAGKFIVQKGPVHAGSLFFEITLEGQSGHGSRPDKSINPIAAFVPIYNYLDSLRLNEISSFKEISYSIGSVVAGDAPNVIPSSLTFKGTARFFDRENVGYPFYHHFKEAIEKISSLYDVNPIFNLYPKPNFPNINDVEAAEFMEKLLVEEFGEDVIVESEPGMGSETFSAFLTQFPGVYISLGIKNEEKGVGADHHNEYFDIDEEAMKYGTVAGILYAIEFLNSDLEFEEKAYKGRFKEFLREIGESEKEIEEIYNIGLVE